MTRNAARVRDYLDCLYTEITMQAELFDKDRVVEQLHFGGGTPTYLDDSQMCQLMTHLSRAFTLETGPPREFSIMDHFASPDDDLVLAKQDGTLQRNFQGYSTHGGSDLVAIGVSAIGHIGNTYAQNSVSTIEYESMVSNKQLPIRKGLNVDENDQIRAAAIQDIMCHDGIDYAVFGQQYSINFKEYFAAELERLTNLAQDKLIVVTDETITVTAKGRLLLRSIAMIFDRYLSSAASDKRFSQAI